jgi:hypothetical protein
MAAIDYMIKKGVAVLTVRKLFQSIGFITPSILLIVQIVMGSMAENPDRNLALVLILLTLCSSGVSICGFGTNPLDLGGSKCSGIIVGIGNTFATLPGMIAPALTGYLLKRGGCNDSYPESSSCSQAWNLTFSICIGLYLFGITIWLSFARAERIPRVSSQ